MSGVQSTSDAQAMWNMGQKSPEDAASSIYQKAKGSKKDFANFIRYYNEHKSELQSITPEEEQSLKKLREMWNSIGRNTSVEFYHSMKDHHTIVGSSLLNCEPWNKYIENFQKWRVLAFGMMMQGMLSGVN